MAEITINLHDQPCGNCAICIGRNIGAKHEQERIIKLLKEARSVFVEDTVSYGTMTGLIALIKGEK